MRYPYVVILKKDSERTIDFISIFLCIFSVLNFFYKQLQDQRWQLFFTVFGVLVLLGTVGNIIMSRRLGMGGRLGAGRWGAGGLAAGRQGAGGQLGAAGLGATGLGPDGSKRSEQGRRQVQYRYWLLIAGLGWLGMPYLPWLGILFFLQSFLEYQVKRPLEIGFSADRVVVNTLFKRSYVWSDFNNIILKDGLLTLDFKDNRLLQKEVADDEDEDDADEDEFNDYCRSRLQEAARTTMVKE